MIKSPVVLLYDAAGNPLVVEDGNPVPADIHMQIAGGKGADGNAHPLRMANDGTIRIDPSGTTVQPVSAISFPLPTGAATSANQSTIIGHIDGLESTLSSIDTNMSTASAPTQDFDTGAGTDLVIMRGIALPAPGGAVIGGTATNPLRTDPTGTTAQPVTDNGGSLTVDGTLTADQGSPNSLANAWPVSVTDGTNVLGTAANPLRVDATGSTVQPISATSLPLPTGAATAANQSTIIGHVDGLEGLLTTIDSVLDGIAAEDFATETTLSGQLNITLSALRDAIVGAPAKTLSDLEDTLESIKTFLDNEDFASETTLAALKTNFDAEDFATAANQTTIIGHVDGLEGLLTTIDAVLDVIAAKDFATETTLAALKTNFDAEDFATEATLATLATNANVTGAALPKQDFDTGAGTDDVTMRGIALPSAGGNVIGGTATDPIRTDPTGTTTQPINQDVQASASNSSTANLGPGATFTGSSESTLSADAIQVNFKADKATFIQVQQSEDGTNWDIEDSYNLLANEGDSRTIQATASFFRVLVTNNASTSTTFLRLSSYLSPVGAALPRSLTRSGNLKVALQDDEHKKPAQFSSFGVPKVAQEAILGDFKYSAASIPLKFNVTSTGTGGYSVEAGDFGVRLTTGASGSSKTEFSSKTAHIYKCGRGYTVKHSIILGDSGVAGNVREWGAATATDGFFLRMNGTALEWVIRSNSSETVIDSADWDIPVTPDSFGHVWYQQLQSFSAGDIYLFYDDKLVHTHRFLGTSTDFLLGKPDLPVWLRNENTSNTTDVYLKVGGSSVVMEGGSVVSGIDSDGQTREVKVDSSGSLSVVVTSASEALPLLVNMNYEASDGAILANAYKRVLDYTIPAGHAGWLIRYSSFQNETAKSRLVAYKELGTLEFIGNTYTPGDSYLDPQWSAVLEAEVTTELSGAGASPITVTVDYTNESGVSGRTGTFSIPKSSVVGSRFVMQRQAGDVGVRSIQNLTDDSPNAGAIKVIGNIQLTYHNDLSNTIQLETNYQPGAIAFPTGTALAVEYQGGTVSKDRLFDLLIQLVEI